MDHDLRVRNKTVAAKFRYGPDTEFKNRVDPNLKMIVKPPKLQHCRTLLSLNGPHSPLETSVVACSRFANQKNATVDPTSVNSIILETAAQERHEKLFVAASVGETRSKNLTIRETTEMPAIPGLAVLMGIMFCPYMELRRDQKRTRYTSLLAGMGYNKQNMRPYFGEHDILLRVDVELKPDDFAEVKKNIIEEEEFSINLIFHFRFNTCVT